MTSPDILFCVDAFAGHIGMGNPAGVCLLTEPADPAWMQMVAREMNLSETAFVLKEENGFGLRWFTPRVEIELAGHPTLATAHILWEEGYLTCNEPARFFTKSGILIAEKEGDHIELDFPEVPEESESAPAGLIEALGVQPYYTGKNRFDYLIEVASEREVREMAPDFHRLGKIPMRGVMVTARATTPGYDFVSRFFAPTVGVNEDPVTGSAHCCLFPFWQKRLGRDILTAFQASERGGVLSLRPGYQGRIKIGGKAVTVWKGSLIS
ncbi:MAG: PhzF family phenazine biosynthesis protein [Methanoregula sp.]|jgi:PhzF family phenazine biosynthesis protein|nr:PhzF family phenazine biosynthesis protein [Methanoregula sp.]